MLLVTWLTNRETETGLTPNSGAVLQVVKLVCPSFDCIIIIALRQSKKVADG